MLSQSALKSSEAYKVVIAICSRYGTSKSVKKRIFGSVPTRLVSEMVAVLRKIGKKEA